VIDECFLLYYPCDMQNSRFSDQEQKAIKAFENALSQGEVTGNIVLPDMKKYVLDKEIKGVRFRGQVTNGSFSCSTFKDCVFEQFTFQNTSLEHCYFIDCTFKNFRLNKCITRDSVGLIRKIEQRTR